MFKKVSDFMSKPITWGAYFKLCVISMVMFVVCLVFPYLAEAWESWNWKKESTEGYQEEEES